MRVISGTCKGRKLMPISGHDIRPTSDRVKEAVFNILGPSIVQSQVLDLFAGTGALGIESLSRGAHQTVFMDKDTHVIAQNLDHCGLAENSRVIECNLLGPERFIPLRHQLFDVIFMDPPYGKKYIEPILEDPLFLTLLKKNTIIIAEHNAKEIIAVNQPLLDIYRQKKYSKTMLSFIRKTA
jgi:16S rRNA (guanine966-N2)-methyltransferase